MITKGKRFFSEYYGRSTAGIDRNKVSVFSDLHFIIRLNSHRAIFHMNNDNVFGAFNLVLVASEISNFIFVAEKPAKNLVKHIITCNGKAHSSRWAFWELAMSRKPVSRTVRRESGNPTPLPRFFTHPE
ncbi:hypothetical protein PSI15_17250 [Xenorhabdus sp. PR6a]|uniref:hypothetical protein n=1 Tax=Xenorhabdus sp. PR6a TaxID=3025877 RepID=UPI00235A191D|nr:hypothetical protein [Xenorhabdus sp. PR6a]MDC9583264.1 hypothetical protein [Xenorhabdus sp. PR6a]